MTFYDYIKPLDWIQTTDDILLTHTALVPPMVNL